MYKRQTHDYVLFVTDRGRLFRIKGYTIAEGSRTSKGMNIVNLLQLADGEKVTNMICQSKDAEQSGGYVTMVTKQGLIKRTPLCLLYTSGHPEPAVPVHPAAGHRGRHYAGHRPQGAQGAHPEACLLYTSRCV